MPRVTIARKDIVKLVGSPNEAGHCAATGTAYLTCLATNKFDEVKCGSELKRLQTCLLVAPQHDRMASTQRRRTLVWNILRAAQKIQSNK